MWTEALWFVDLPEPLNGEVEFRIAEGLLNVLGERFLEPVVKTLTFTVNKPAVEFLGEGTIVPPAVRLRSFPGCWTQGRGCTHPPSP